MISFWEKESFISYDYIIVGSGIVGISTAISLKEQNPKASILVLERGSLPSGASTKNAGFACFGSLTELLNDLETLGKSGTLELVNERWKGLCKLRERVGDENLNYLNYGGFELLRDQELPYLERVEEVNELLSTIFDQPVFEIQNDKISSFGFSKTEIKSMIYNRYEGQVHTGKMMHSLIRMAQRLGINILTGTTVKSFSDEGKLVHIQATGVNDSIITFTARKVGLCTNAFTTKLIPDLNIEPGRGIVLVTKPIQNLPFKGVFHIDQGYYYFRNYQDRVLFGGGRNLDFEGEKTTSLDVNDTIIVELKRQLSEIILPNHSFEVDHTWAGIMAFGKNKAPILKKHSDNIYLGVRLGGMGVAIGSQMGEKLAKNMME